ncbi:hypothetical protein SG34_012675 [Thalassomonas viridans]|uniref:Uncharacterized protein n=1 Tax=Thalassomonas viridans TaxID=137584 RepID=A0AAE9Z9P6_9GAMM|nr:hypothetical protein [Thalassomonas viridans]WDE07667.1 hypothetical protein SG34_012675 [Thalassomonas viridans]
MSKIKFLSQKLRSIAESAFDPRKYFFQLWTVRFAVISVLSIIALTIWGLEKEYTFQLCKTTVCYNDFVRDFKFQLGLLASLIPILAVCAAQHRSVISLEQIKVAEAQNTFANHFKHQEEFEKYIKGRDELAWIDDCNSLHRAIFTQSKQGDYTISFTYMNEVTNVFLRTFELIKDAANKGEKRQLLAKRIANNFSISSLSLRLPLKSMFFNFAQDEGYFSRGTKPDNIELEEVIEVLIDFSVLENAIFKAERQMEMVIRFYTDHTSEAIMAINVHQIGNIMRNYYNAVPGDE